jgi:hypothetical protein
VTFLWAGQGCTEFTAARIELSSSLTPHLTNKLSAHLRTRRTNPLIREDLSLCFADVSVQRPGDQQLLVVLNGPPQDRPTLSAENLA